VTAHAPSAVAPPATAIRLLERSLPPEERDAIVGDLFEILADRLDVRRRFNRTPGSG
jgi:hypothetical protein